MSSRRLLLVAVIAAVAALGPVAAAAGQAVVHQITPLGTEIVPSAGIEPGGPSEVPRSTYIWRSTHPSMIGSSTGIAISPGRADVMVGHENAPPTPVEVFEAEGTGTPYWTSTASFAQVAARGQAYALADFVQGHGITLTGWYQDLATPAWTYSLPTGVPTSYGNTLHIDMAGTRVYYGCLNPTSVRLIVLAADTGTSLLDKIVPLDTPSLRGMAISDDGRFVDLNCGAWHVVFDVENQVERARVNVGASTNPVGISETGEWIVSGFNTTKAFQWDPGTNSYILRWTRSTSGFYAGVAAVSEQGYWIVVWYRSSYTQNRYIRWNLATGGIDWTYDSPASSGAVQDLPVGIDYTPDRGKYAFANWGDATDTSPEILVLNADGTEATMVHAPGSMYDVAISADGKYVSATGKLVHANVFGSGSDAYCAAVGDPAAVDPLDLHLVGTGGLHVWPNPTAGETRILPISPSSVAGPLWIHDASGRLLRTFPACPPDGVTWTGTDDANAPLPAGIYFARSAQGAQARIVRIR